MAKERESRQSRRRTLSSSRESERERRGRVEAASDVWRRKRVELEGGGVVMTFSESGGFIDRGVGVAGESTTIPAKG